jgi:hypothetical protein
LKIKEYSKQYVRDTLLEMGFDGTKALKLPPSVVVECAYIYISVYEQITGQQFQFPTEKVKGTLAKNLAKAGMISSGCVAVLAGSESDQMTAIRKLKEGVAKYGLPCVTNIVPTKEPAKLEELMKYYNRSVQRMVILTCADGAQELSSAASVHSLHPVVSCPPAKDGCPTPPSRTTRNSQPPNGFVCSPANAVRFAAQVCGGAAVEKMLLEETALKVKGLEEADRKAFPTADDMRDRAFDPPERGDGNPKHECGVALLRLVRSAEYYEDKYGSGFTSSRMRLLMDKQKNRGQDGAGMACLRFDVPPGEGYLDVCKSNQKNCVDDIFEQVAERRQFSKKDFVGNVFLGHVRYGTFGGNQYENLHPVVRESNYKGQLLALAGNFNLTNTQALMEEQLRVGLTPLNVTDTRLCLESIGHHLSLELRRRYMEFSARGAGDRESMRLAEANLDIAAGLRPAAPGGGRGYLLSGIVGTRGALARRGPPARPPAGRRAAR